MFDSPAEQARSILETIAAAEKALSTLAKTDLGALDGTELMNGIVDLEQCRRFLDSAVLAGLAQVDSRGDSLAHSGLPTKNWYAHAADLPAPVARRRMTTARFLSDDVPDAAEAMSDGNLNSEQVDHLAKVTNDRNREAMTDLIGTITDWADTSSFRRWAQDVSQLAEALDEDGAHDPAGDEPASRLSTSRSGDMLRLTGEFHGPDGHLIESAINKFHDEVFRDPVTDKGTPGEQRAEALTRLCERALGVELGSSKKPNSTVTLVLNPADPTAVADDSGFLVDHERFGAVLCDPVFHPLVANLQGVPLDAGRSARYASADQRRALALRDGGCIIAGCDKPAAWTDAHHIEEWDADHGASDLANFASLCRAHHVLVHKPGWNLNADDHGVITVTNPNGVSIPVQRHGRIQRPRDG